MRWLAINNSLTGHCDIALMTRTNLMCKDYSQPLTACMGDGVAPIGYNRDSKLANETL